jgi:hypothetical protein
MTDMQVDVRRFLADSAAARDRGILDLDGRDMAAQHTELRWLFFRTHQLWKDSGCKVPSLEESRLRIAEREVAVYERIAADQKRPSRAVRDGLAAARQLHARLAAEVAEAEAAKESVANVE